LVADAGGPTLERRMPRAAAVIEQRIPRSAAVIERRMPRSAAVIERRIPRSAAVIGCGDGVQMGGRRERPPCAAKMLQCVGFCWDFSNAR
jgi:hypothetical protein